MVNLAYRSEADRLVDGNRIGRPSPVRDRSGRWQRDPSAEWDWFYSLPDTERTYIQREWMIDGGVRPDVAADWEGLSVDEWAEQWTSVVRLSRAGSADPLEWEFDGPYTDEPSVVRERVLGLSDLADHVGAKRSTAYKWQQRGQLPPADMAVSGQPAWWESTVDAWWSAR